MSAIPMHTLEIKNLRASVSGKEILKGVSLRVRSGEIHAIMGPNGSGKSTLSYVLMGHPKYTVTSGEVLFDNENMLLLTPDKRAKLGLFLGFQYPVAVPGVSFSNFLRQAKAWQKGVPEFLKFMKEKMKLLSMSEDFLTRSVNEGFSGGEKKRAEIVQLAVLEPNIAVLDETDSGLDIDALKIVAEGIKRVAETTSMGVILITHYQRILDYITPNFVHIMHDGKIIHSGDMRLARDLEKQGYEHYLTSAG